MGKRYKRLTMPKYALKYAARREALATLRTRSLEEKGLDETPNELQDTSPPPEAQAQPAAAINVAITPPEAKKPVVEEPAAHRPRFPAPAPKKELESAEISKEPEKSTPEAAVEAGPRKKATGRKIGKRTVATRQSAKAKATSRN